MGIAIGGKAIESGDNLVIIGIQPAGIAIQGKIVYEREALPEPELLPTGMVVWLDATQITGLSEGDPVPTWPDSSGNANDAITAGNPPSFVLDAINGLAAVKFSNPELTSLVIANLVRYFEGRGVTLFMLFEPQLPTGGSFSLLQGGTDTWECFNSDPVSGTWFGSVFREPRIDGGSLGISFPSSGTHIYEILSSDLDYQALQNGNLLYSGSPNFFPEDNPLSIGFAYNISQKHFNGLIAELIIYPRTLSQEERQSVRSYLSSKWAIPLP